MIVNGDDVILENEKKLFTQLKQESNFNPRNKSTFEAT